MTALDYRDGVSIAQLIIYVPALAIAVFLSIRHGFSIGSGWRFLIIFALSRVLSSSFELGTIGDRDNMSLNIGYVILISIALSPLIMAALGLLSRIVSSINKSKKTLITPKIIVIIQILVGIGLILGIVGGDLSGVHYGEDGVYEVHVLTKVSVIIFTVSLVALSAFITATFPQVTHAEDGEKRLLYALSASLPFLWTRLIYSLISVFGHTHKFSLLGGDETVLLCMAFLEEIIVVVIYEAVGLTLKKIPKNSATNNAERGSNSQQRFEMPGLGPKGSS